MQFWGCSNSCGYVLNYADTRISERCGAARSQSTGHDGKDHRRSTDFHNIDGMRHTGVPGDFYSSNDVVIGVSMGEIMGNQLASASAPEADRYHESYDMLQGIDYTGAASWTPCDMGFACDGDPFRETDVTRGVTLASDPETLFHELDETVGCEAQPDMPTRGFSKVQPGRARMPLSNAPFYLPADEPSPVPTHAFFKLNNTTIQVSTKEPWDIGNELLTFLREKSTSDILKPNEKTSTMKKYFIKAHVFAQPGMCVMKIKIYQDQPRGTYSIEFQRRSGDSVAFINTFMEVAKHLKDTKKFEMKKLPKCALQPFAPPPLPKDSLDTPPPVPAGLLRGQPAQEALFDIKALKEAGFNATELKTKDESEFQLMELTRATQKRATASETQRVLAERCAETTAVEDSIWNSELSQSFEADASLGEAQDPEAVQIAPLLDMAGMSGMTMLQAEAAMALADLARDARALKALCTDEAFDKMKTLLANPETAVAYPTAKVLNLLASSSNPKAQEIFSQTDVWELISQKAETTESSLVQRELTQLASCRVKLPKKTSFGQSSSSYAGFAS